MPWDVRKNGSRYCVYKKGSSSPIAGGCHATRADAIKHQRALYANEASLAKKKKKRKPMMPYASAKESTVLGMEETTPTFRFVGNPALGTYTATGTSNTVTVTIAEPEEEEEAQTTPWEGVLGLEGHPTADRRYLLPGRIAERDLPHPLMVQVVNDEGHKGSELGGRVETISRIPISEFSDPDFDFGDLPEDAVIIWGTGVFDDSEAGQDGQRLVENGGGISFDLSVDEIQLLDPETFEPLEEEPDLMDLLFGGGEKFVTGIAGTIMGSTVVPFAAFPEAAIRLTASGTLTWSGIGKIRIVKPVLTASAAGLAPLNPPREWFEIEEPSEPMPLTVDDDGRVYGHLALWDQCHTGYKDYCQVPPRSASNYKFFHLGEIETDDGSRLGVGKITVGTGHAPISYGSVKTLEHYDNTGCVAAFVRARDGRHGIWLSGAIRSDLPAEKIRDLRANPPSGDWRRENGSLELQGVLAVPIPGFPVPRSEARLVASGDVEELEALYATGYAVEKDEEEMAENGDGHLSKAELRKMIFDFAVENATAWECDGFKNYTAEQRRKMAKDGRALPDGSYPIADCADANNARRAIGRTPAGNRGRVRSHIARRERALGCKASD